MDYRFIDRSQAVSNVRRQDALQAVLQAAQAEVIHAAATVEDAEQQEATEKLRAKADAKVKAAKLTDAEVAKSTKDFLESWLQSIEQEHANVETKIAIGEENDEECPGCEEQLRNLAALLAAGYEAFDAVSTEPVVKGDGGTAKRQARRGAKAPKPQHLAEVP